ncbi:MAG: CCA tRNA nucleotidyltransferase [Alphaproteobacteria bacterium]|nr:CCA tRNA nucleotidyltransferase [Alphaproteobacteria bacterium]
MIRDNYLDVSKITTDAGILKVFDIVQSHGGIIRFVGGAVRDAIAGKSGSDLNLSTDLSPDELLEVFEDAGIKTVPIGLKSGVSGVIINNTLLEITSLSKSNDTSFNDDWQSDASTRDLTINAVYADDRGNVFDYYNGIDDLEKGIVRFIGDPNQRIKEDYLRILRFFRFHSLFAKTAVNKEGLKACIDNRQGLNSVSIERIRDELIKIILTPNAAEVLKVMLDNEILGNWLGKSPYLSNLAFLIRIENSLNITLNPLRRLFVMYFPDKTLAENIAARFHLSKRQKETLIRWTNPELGIENIMEETLRTKIIYHYGKEFCIDKLIIEASRRQDFPEGISGLIKDIESTSIPVFPLTGREILEKANVSQKQVGAIMERLKDAWLASGFKLTKDELLSKI